MTLHLCDTTRTHKQSYLCICFSASLVVNWNFLGLLLPEKMIIWIDFAEEGTNVFPEKNPHTIQLHWWEG